MLYIAALLDFSQLLLNFSSRLVLLYNTLNLVISRVQLWAVGRA